MKNTMKNKLKAFASIMLLLTMGIGQVWGTPTTTSLCPTSDLSPAQGIVNAFVSSDTNLDDSVYVARAGGGTNIYTASGVSKANTIAFQLKSSAKVYFTLYNNNGNNKTTTAYFMQITEECYNAIKLTKTGGRVSTKVASWSSDASNTPTRSAHDSIKVYYNKLKSADSSTDKVILGVTPTAGIGSVLAVDGMPYDVYNLQGVKVRANTKTLKGLASGVYVVNGKKITVK